VFVLTHTADVIHGKCSGAFTIAMIIGAFIIIGLFIAEEIYYRRWKKELDKKYPNSRK
jgi:uncharacterized membrane protein (DUF485 family)